MYETAWLIFVQAYYVAAHSHIMLIWFGMYMRHFIIPLVTAFIVATTGHSYYQYILSSRLHDHSISSVSDLHKLSQLRFIDISELIYVYAAFPDREFTKIRYFAR